MLKQEINRYIRPIRNKLVYQQILSKCLLVLFVVSWILMAIAIASHVVVILYVEWWMAGGALLGLMLGLVWGLILFPKKITVLKATDQLGYDERLMTAWQLDGDSSVEAQLQRDDTLETIKANDHRKQFKIKWHPKRLLQTMALIVVAIGILFIESPSREAAKNAEEMIDEILAEEEKLTELAEEILEEEEVPEEIKDQMEALLKELEDQLKEAKTEEEALKALSIAKDEIKKLDMEELKDKLAQLEAQMKDMEEQSGENLSEEDMKEKMEALEKALEALEESGLEMDEAKALEEALEALKEAMEASDSEALAEALEKAAEMTDAAMEALENAGTLSESMQAAINEAGKALSTNPTVSEMAFAASQEGEATQAVATEPSDGTGGTQSQSEGTPTAAGQGQGDGQGQGEGEGQGQGQGQGSGSGSGSGSGQGQGAGEGQGTGSTNEDSGYKDGESSGGGGWFQGEDKSEDYEALYPPEHIGGSSDPTFVQGNRSDGGDSEVQQVEGAPTLAGDLVSYKELYAEYNDQAMHSVEDMDIPILMKDLVKAYFTSLDDE